MSNSLIITSVIDSVFSSTNKNFIAFQAIREMLPENVRNSTNLRDLTVSGYHWKTMVVSEHGFRKEFQAQYKKEAVKNIPKIYYGKGGFENYDVKGGCCYVLVRN